MMIARARAHIQINFAREMPDFARNRLFFYFFVQMTLKVVYIEYMNFLALKLNINPLYGWYGPLI